MNVNVGIFGKQKPWPTSRDLLDVMKTVKKPQ
jgi:hypothetical protein